MAVVVVSAGGFGVPATLRSVSRDPRGFGVAGVVSAAAIVLPAVCRGALLVALVVTALVGVSRSLLGRARRARGHIAALLVASRATPVLPVPAVAGLAATG